MALLWMDGFDKYSAAADLGLRTTEVNTGVVDFLPTGGRGGGGCIEITDSSSDTAYRITLPSNVVGGPLHVAFWFYLENITRGQLLTLYNTGGTNGADFTLVSGSRMETERWGGSGDYLEGVNPGYCDGKLDQWIHFEMAANYQDAGGFVKVWLDNNLVINITAADTIFFSGAPTLNRIALKSETVFDTIIRFDDLVVWDESGSDFTMAHLEPHKIESLAVTADGNAVDFTPSAGDNHENVDESGFHDGDTTYNQSAGAGDQDLYALEDLSSPPDGIHAIQVNSIAKHDGTPTNVQNVVRTGGTDFAQTAQALGSSYQRHVNFLAENPDTGMPWTESDVNSLEAGVAQAA